MKSLPLTPLSLLLFIVVVSRTSSSSYSDWVPNALTNGQKSTICSCGLSPDCDNPWIVWGYIVKRGISLVCVILNNVKDTPLNIHGDSPSRVTSIETLSKYLDYHIYYNDSLHMRQVRDNRSSEIITGFKNGTDNLTYDLKTRSLAVNNNRYSNDSTPLLKVETLKTFRVFTTEYYINGLKYVYRGVVRDQEHSCFDINRKVWVVPSVFDLL